MAIERQLRLGLLQVQLAAIPWSLLCLELAEAGHRPSAPSPFDDPYTVQALALPLLLGLQWCLCTILVFSRCVTSGHHVSLGTLARDTGACLGFPLLIAFVLPDYLAWRTGGFSSMTQIFPITALVCLVLLGLGGIRTIQSQTPSSRIEALKIFAYGLFWSSLPILVLVR